MPRVPRRWQWTEEACYHLMDRGHNREAWTSPRMVDTQLRV